ncbi:MAG: hypothetical protein JNM69_07690 [Archangium sp.]|nr:hypothetical protein [Archangium sp.]
MSDKTRSASSQTFDEREVAEILRRAASLEQKRKLERPTLSLAEVETIAREAGIDPALVRRAVDELAHEPKQSFWAKLAGAPLSRTLERVVDGELTADDHETLAISIREALGQPSGFPVQVSVLGRSLSATTFGGAGLVEVQVTPKDGTTRVRVTVNAKQVAGGLFGGIIGGVGGGLGSNVAWMVPVWLAKAGYAPELGVLGGAVGLFATVFGAYSFARWLFVGRARAMHARASQLAETLETQLRTAIANRAGVAPVR